MFGNIASWFIGLSKVAKASVITSAVVGGMVVGTAVNPSSTPTETTPPPVVQPSITTKTETETAVIPFSKESIEDGTLAKGVTKIQTPGVDGVKTITHKITLTDGVETGRDTSEEITTAPVTEITAIGTYVAPPPVKATPAPQQSYSSGVVKKSRSNICHAPGTTYYDRTKNFTPYNSLDECLSSGGRMPKR